MKVEDITFEVVNGMLSAGHAFRDKDGILEAQVVYAEKGELMSDDFKERAFVKMTERLDRYRKDGKYGV